MDERSDMDWIKSDTVRDRNMDGECGSVNIWRVAMRRSAAYRVYGRYESMMDRARRSTPSRYIS